MNRQFVHTGKRVLRACIPFLALSFTMRVDAATGADTSPEPGTYCPDTNVLLIVAEELSASLDLAMRSRTALINKDQTSAVGELTTAGIALQLAASRGAAARTVLLIDAVIEAKPAEDYTRMLAWFPLLHASLLTLPDDANETAAEDMISGAGQIMQGDKAGDPVKLLNQARHMLACDGLDIPLQEAMHARDALMRQLGQGGPVKNSDYDALLDALRNALLYALGK